MMPNVRPLTTVVLALLVLAGCSHGPELRKVALITGPGGLGDHSVNDAAWAGLQRCAAADGATIRSVEPAGPADIDAAALHLATENFAQIVAVGPQAAEPVANIAKHFEHTFFTVIGGQVLEPNVASVRFATEQGAYLAGALAALVSRSGTIGFLGGEEDARVDADLTGYRAGAKAVRPGIRIASNLHATFTDDARARAAAAALVTGGADVTFVVAGRAGLAAIATIAASPGGDAIGVDADQDATAPGRVLTSVLAKADVAALRACEDSIGQKPATGPLDLGLAEGAVALTQPAGTRVTPAIWTRVDQLQAAIVAGTIRVSPGAVTARSSAAYIAALTTIPGPPPPAIASGRALRFVWGWILIAGFLIFFAATSAVGLTLKPSRRR